MGSLNLVILIGNLGRDAELRYTPGGAAVANFSVATTEVWNDKSGQRQERTEWHQVTLWGKQAESLAQYLKKGKSVSVTGKIQTREWTDDNQQKHKATDIRAERVVLLGGNGASRPPVTVVDDEARELVGAISAGVDPDEDLPF